MVSDVSGSHTVEIAAPPAECAAVLTDIERYPEWYDTLDSVHVVERLADGRPLVAACTADAGPLGALAFKLRLAYQTGAIVGDQVAGDGRVDGVRMEWALEPVAAGRTRVRYSFQANARGLATRIALKGARRLVERDLIELPAEALKRAVERAYES